MPAEEFSRVDEGAYPCGLCGLAVDFLVTDHRGDFEIDTVLLGQFLDHATPGLAAAAAIRVVVGADLPGCQNVTELTIKFTECGFDPVEREAATFDLRLIGDDEDQMVA